MMCVCVCMCMCVCVRAYILIRTIHNMNVSRVHIIH